MLGKAGGERDDRGWDGWMASWMQWTWVWASSGSWWWTGTPGVLQSMGLQRVGQDLVTEQQQLKQILVQSVHISTHHNSQKDESNSNVHQLCWEHTVEYYSTIKRKELWQHGTTWMNSVNFMLTERSQTQKITYGSLWSLWWQAVHSAENYWSARHCNPTPDIRPLVELLRFQGYFFL